MIQPEKIHIVSINIFKAQLNTSDAYLDQPQRPEGLSFGFEKKIAHNFEEGRFRFRLFFQLVALDQEGQKLGVEVEYGLEFHFEVENVTDFIQKEGEETRLDIGLMATLLGMAFSTARGIIFERTRGTFFEGIVLPVIDPFKAIQEDTGLQKV